MSATHFIRYEDFASVKVRLKLRNLVTQTVVDSKVKTLEGGTASAASEANALQLVEILKNGVAMSVPKLTCTIGHNLEIHFHVLKLASEPMEFGLLGKVVAVDKSLDDQDRIEVEFKLGSGSSEELWKEFCQRFAAKQDSIDALFQSIRGY